MYEKVLRWIEEAFPAPKLKKSEAESILRDAEKKFYDVGILMVLYAKVIKSQQEFSFDKRKAPENILGHLYSSSENDLLEWICDTTVAEPDKAEKRVSSSSHQMVAIARKAVDKVKGWMAGALPAEEIQLTHEKFDDDFLENIQRIVSADYEPPKDPLSRVLDLGDIFTVYGYLLPEMKSPNLLFLWKVSVASERLVSAVSIDFTKICQQESMTNSGSTLRTGKSLRNRDKGEIHRKQVAYKVFDSLSDPMKRNILCIKSERSPGYQAFIQAADTMGVSWVPSSDADADRPKPKQRKSWNKAPSAMTLKRWIQERQER